MSILQRRLVLAAALTFISSAAAALEMTCTHPERPNNTYSITGDQGIYTWDDHDIERVWKLKCSDQRSGLSSCHRSERYGERGTSVITFVMLSDGRLVQSGYWALLDVSRVSVTPGFVCLSDGK